MCTYSWVTPGVLSYTLHNTLGVLHVNEHPQNVLPQHLIFNSDSSAEGKSERLLLLVWLEASDWEQRQLKSNAYAAHTATYFQLLITEYKYVLRLYKSDSHVTVVTRHAGCESMHIGAACFR